MMKKKIKMRILAFTVAAMVAVTPVTTFAEGTKEVIAEDENKMSALTEIMKMRCISVRTDILPIFPQVHLIANPVPVYIHLLLTKLIPMLM